ncbi:MAG: MucB/RseB C-terminal domain-containing protein [Rubrivivax sp.]|nr:MucB/RseB C-terminal domain-containing protein [Rubrivivax sp.]
MKFWWIILLGFVPGTALAAGESREALAILEKMAEASQKVNYSGTFMFQHGNQVETSRIAHFVNPAGGVLERLETLDGPAREVIRNNDQVTCYLPGSKTVLIDPRGSRQFPVRVEQIQEIVQHYNVVKGGMDRVAGMQCQWVTLTPNDNLRYTRRFCAELNTGLPLQARTLNDKNETLEAFAFSTLDIGGSFRREMVQSKYAAMSVKQNWRVDRSALSVDDSGDSGWVVQTPPAGFRKLMELRRSMVGKKGKASHLVYSDGLAAVSIFIEPGAKPDQKQALRHQGALHIYSHVVAGHTVTILGETPAETVLRFARSLEPKTAATALR